MYGSFDGCESRWLWGCRSWVLFYIVIPVGCLFGVVYNVISGGCLFGVSFCDL